MKRSLYLLLMEAAAVLAVLIIFGIPMLFVITNAGKTSMEAAQSTIGLSETPQYWSNITEVLKAADYMLPRAFYNSTLITVFSILLLIGAASMTGFVLARRVGRPISAIQFFVMAGLMLPPSIVPTIWVLRLLGLYKTLYGIVLIEAALNFPFAALLYRGYMGAIPRELDEASFVDGCTGFQLFFKVIFPLLKPISVTVAILASINIFNDFVNPLYFLPGAKNATVQLTLYNFISMYFSRWNLLFADILLISIPPLIFFILFNKKIVSGMVAGAVKG
jgi:raffinose/stachyose/melibiose transport system permease protein